jgi:hypothetical protein
MSKLHGEWVPNLTRSVRRGWLGLPWHFYWFPGILRAEVDEARDDP